MNYQISEEEFNSLESVGGHLGLVAGLLTAANERDWLSHVTASHLLAFVQAQEGAVARVIASATAEPAAHAPKASQVAIAPELMMGLIDAAGGELSDELKLCELFDKLYELGVENPAYRGIAGHYASMLQSRGWVFSMEFSHDGQHRRLTLDKARRASAPSAATPKPRKREKLARVGV